MGVGVMFEGRQRVGAVQEDDRVSKTNRVIGKIGGMRRRPR